MWRFWALPFAFAFFHSTFLIWEQDIFWQLRAGNELLLTGALPHEDQWSYTSRGRQWINVQWLSTVVVALAHRLACSGADHFGPLILLRAAVVAAFVAQAGHVAALAADACGNACSPAAISAATPRGEGAWAGALPRLLVPFTWRRVRVSSECDGELAVVLSSACARSWRRWVCAWAAQVFVFYGSRHRLQLRSETFSFCAFLAIWQIWLLPALKVRARLLGGLAMVILSGQLHGGTSPFAVGVAVCCLLSVPSPLRLRSRLVWAALTALGYFCTPYTFRLIHLHWHALVKIYVFFSFFVPFCSFFPLFRALTMCALCVLVAMTFNRIRCAPYAVAFAVPLAAHSLCWVLDALAVLALSVDSTEGRGLSQGEVARRILASSLREDMPRICAESFIRDPPSPLKMFRSLWRQGVLSRAHDDEEGIEFMWGSTGGLLRGGGKSALWPLAGEFLPAHCRELRDQALPRLFRPLANLIAHALTVSENIRGRGLASTFPIGCVDFLRVNSGLPRAGGNLTAANAALGWSSEAARGAGVDLTSSRARGAGLDIASSRARSAGVDIASSRGALFHSNFHIPELHWLTCIPMVIFCLINNTRNN
ncbi:hypothetical protein T492DRAFT_1079431 [Pavlovales sp. CCMP2436]|nr:hypothetical protein T492DRAFT_1079431 [Pavlovales sp. CCMP2436]